MKPKAFRKLIYTIIFVVTVVFVFLGVYQIHIHNFLLNRSFEGKYTDNEKSIDLLQSLEKEILTSVAVSISSDENIKKSLIDENREKALKLLYDKWQFLKKEFGISEIHITLTDGSSFVNFVDLGYSEIKENNRYILTHFRKDVEKSIRTGKPISTLFVCRYFVGFRSVYPIKEKNRLIGVVSVGKSIEKIIPILKEKLNKNSFAVLNVEKIKSCMNAQVINKKYPDADGKRFVLIGQNFGLSSISSIDFSKNYFLKSTRGREYLYSLFPLTDFSGSTVGYIVIQDDVSFLKQVFRKSIFNITVTYAVLLAGIIGTVLFFSSRFERRLSEIEEITERLSGRDFSVLNNYRYENEERDDLVKLKNQIVKMGSDLRGYITELNRKMIKLSEENYTDPLLGVLNRRALLKIGASEIEKARIRELPLCVMVLDLDDFKSINDKYGHNAGDMVLKDFVRCVKNVISSRELLFRIGGEEFLIMMPGADIKKAIEIGEKIRKEVENSSIQINSEIIKYTVSIGVAQLGDDEDIYSLILRADQQLYRSKREGKNRISY